MAESYRLTDDFERAEPVLREAEALADAVGDDVALARVRHLIGNLCYPKADWEGARREHRAALRLAQKASEHALEASCRIGLADADYMRGHMRSALATLQAALDFARTHGVARAEAAALSMICNVGLYLLDFEPALRASEEALERAIALGHKRAEMATQNGRIAVFYAQGDWARCAVETQALLEAARRIGSRRNELIAFAYSARLALRRGDRQEALALIDAAWEIAVETDKRMHAAQLLGIRAAASVDDDERRGAIAEGERLIRLGSVAHNALHFYPNAIASMLDMGDVFAAKRLVEDFARIGSVEPLPWIDALVGRDAARIAIRAGENVADERSPVDHAARRFQFGAAFGGVAATADALVL